MHILKADNICFKNFFIEKKYEYTPSTSHYLIKYIHNDKKDNLVIQTPTMMIPFGISNINNNKYLDISFLNKEENKETNLLFDFFIKLNKKINKHFKKNNYITFHKFNNNIKKAIDIYPERLRLKVLDNIVIFDQNKNIVNTNLNSKINAKILINVSHVYVNNDKLVYGIHFNTHQVQVINYLPKIIQFSFIEDTISSELENSIYNKYYKMVDLGVNLEAIKIEIKANNLDINKLNNYITQKKNKKLIHNELIPPPPPPPFLMKNEYNLKNNSKNNNTKNLLLNEIKNGINLKKCEKEKQKKLNNLKDKYKHDFFEAPNQNTLQKILGNLKKTNSKFKIN